jgi:hypothetical protein
MLPDPQLGAFGEQETRSPVSMNRWGHGRLILLCVLTHVKSRLIHPPVLLPIFNSEMRRGCAAANPLAIDKGIEGAG